MEVVAPWPEELPKGRVLLAQDRHLTLVFLGDSNMPDLESFPKPPFRIGLAGIFNKPLFLSNVVAWHIDWLEEGLLSYQNQLAHWLNIKGNFLSHVTIARKPYLVEGWSAQFEKLPMYVKNINLYESLGGSKYKILWQYPLLAPFEEIEHTADLAFRIRQPFYLHAQLALAFHFPAIVRYFESSSITNLDEIVFYLNAMIAKTDSEIGCPFKAVSFHGTENPTNEWEMIVDV